LGHWLWLKTKLEHKYRAWKWTCSHVEVLDTDVDGYEAEEMGDEVEVEVGVEVWVEDGAPPAGLTQTVKPG
jgi:hypothetical protein